MAFVFATRDVSSRSRTLIKGSISLERRRRPACHWAGHAWLFILSHRGINHEPETRRAARTARCRRSAEKTVENVGLTSMVRAEGSVAVCVLWYRAQRANPGGSRRSLCRSGTVIEHRALRDQCRFCARRGSLCRLLVPSCRAKICSRDDVFGREIDPLSLRSLSHSAPRRRRRQRQRIRLNARWKN